MGKGFTLYTLICIIVLLFGYFFSNTFLIVLFVVLALAPILFKALLDIDAKNINLSLDIDHDCIKNEKSFFEVSITSKKPLLIAGLIYFNFEVIYDKYGESYTRLLKIPATENRGKVVIPFEATMCSAITIKCKSVECNDIIGVTKAKLKPPKPMIFGVYPTALPVTTNSSEHTFFTTDSDQIMQSKKGNDMSEIFEFRDYAPGDNVKSIHWKLSCKIDKPIVKVGHSSTNSRTLIFLDIGKEIKGKKIESQMLSLAVDLAFTISRQLIDKGIGHKFCSTDEDNISFYDINDANDILYAERHILSSPLPKQNGIGISHFIMSTGYKDFAKIIYIYAEEYLDDLLTLSLTTDVSAINISSKHSDIELTTDNKCRFYSLPYNKIASQTYNIDL